jgi:hypothetical protein
MAKPLRNNQDLNHDAGDAGIVPTISHTLALKGGVGKTIVSRAAICRYFAAGLAPRIVQVDRTSALPALYGEAVIAIGLPGSEAQRADPLGTLRALEPLADAIDLSLADGRPLVNDVGGGQHSAAVVAMIGKSRLDAHVAKRARSVVFIPMVAEPATMAQGVELVQLVEQAHPNARIIPVLNLRDGAFKFFRGSAADQIMARGVQPMLERHPPLELPAIPAGALAPFDAHNVTFTHLIEAEPIDLARRLGVSRAMAATLQGDLAEWLGQVWGALEAILPIAKGGQNV